MQNIDRETRIKQLKFRAWRRGFREHDFLMGTFADEFLETLDETGLNNFDALLMEQDWDVYYWIIGQMEAPNEFQTPILSQLQTFASLKNTLWVGDIKS